MYDQLKKQFVSHEIAKDLKDLKFDFGCLAYYDEQEVFHILGQEDEPIGQLHLTFLTPEITQVPLYSQVIEWFRIKHKIKIDIQHSSANGTETFTLWRWSEPNNVGKWERLGFIGSLETYNQAVDKAIREACKLISKELEESNIYQ